MSCGLAFKTGSGKGKANDRRSAITLHYEKTDPSENVKESRRAIYDQWLAWVGKALPNHGRLLDVGCGDGFFLNLARQGGWTVSGIELSPVLAESARQAFGIDVLCQPVEEACLDSASYDVVTLWNVLDQVPTPVSCIRALHSALRPGGLLFTRTPNSLVHLTAAAAAQVTRSIGLGFLFPRDLHVFHDLNFNPGSLYRLLSVAGFSEICVRNSRPTRGDPYSGRKSVGYLKHAYWVLCCLVSSATAGKAQLASSLASFAWKRADTARRCSTGYQ